MTEIVFKPIGIIHTPHVTKENMPIQPLSAKGIKAKVVVNPEYADGLMDLEGFSHAILLYHLHESSGFDLHVKPFMDKVEHGIFATRAPRRPNAIGMSTVKVLGIEGNNILVEDVDILNVTPLIDIKPFFSKFDNRPDAVSGWLDENWHEKNKTLKSDDRFNK